MPTIITTLDFERAGNVVQRIGLEHLRYAVAEALAQERERCAKVAEGLNGWGSRPAPELAAHIAKVIRQG